MIEFKKKILILTGPSGTGKDSVMNSLVDNYGFKKVLTCCAKRPMRPGEKQGVDYDFMTEAAFKEMIERNELLEYKDYGETLKGTRKSSLVSCIDGPVVWRIDAETAAKVKTELFPRKNLADLVPLTGVVYVGAENVFDLYRRQSFRDAATPKKVILERMRLDWEVWKNNQTKYDLIVINRNGRLDETVEQVLAFCRR